MTEISELPKFPLLHSKEGFIKWYISTYGNLLIGLKRIFPGRTGHVKAINHAIAGVRCAAPTGWCEV